MEKKEYPTQNKKISLGQAMRAHIDYVPPWQQLHNKGFTMYPIKCNPSDDGKKLFCTLNIRDEIGNEGVYGRVEGPDDAEANGEFVIDKATGKVDIINLYVSAEMDTYHYDRVKREVLNEQNKNNGGE